MSGHRKFSLLLLFLLATSICIGQMPPSTCGGSAFDGITDLYPHETKVIATGRSHSPEITGNKKKDKNSAGIHILVSNEGQLDKMTVEQSSKSD